MSFLSDKPIKSFLSITGFILTVASILFAIWVYYDSKKQQEVSINYYIESVENLLEVKESLPELRVLYKNTPIENTNMTIKIMTLSVRNEGATVLQNYYDSKIPFGIRFENSDIIDAKMIDSNSIYLNDFKKNISFFENSSHRDFIEFNKLIIEKKSQIKFKIYLFTKNTWKLKSIYPIGKIANMNDFNVYNATTNRNKEYTIGFSFLYGIILFAMLTIFIIFGFIIFAIDKYTTSKRRSIVNNYYSDKPITELDCKIMYFFTKLIQSYHYPILNALVSGEFIVINVNDYIPKVTLTYAFPFNFLIPKKFYPKSYTVQPMIFPDYIFIIDNGQIKLNPNKFIVIKDLTTAISK